MIEQAGRIAVPQGLLLPHNWKPRPYQLPAWKYLSGGGKRAVMLWHRRSGKDETLLHHVACASTERVGNYWYMLPQYSQARKSMWDAVNPKTGKRRIDDAFPMAMRSNTRDHEMIITFLNGSTFQLVGSDNFNSLVGSPPIGLVFSEYALSDPSSWGYLMPIVEENGGWVAFNSTPRGNNHFKELCKFAQNEEGWFFQQLNASETGVFTEKQLSNILRQLQSTHGDEFGYALFQQEYNCSFDAAIPGSIWGDCMLLAQSQGRIGTVPIDPNYPVSTAWDLGRTDDTAIWFFQLIDKQIRIVDFHASSFKDIPFYGRLLREWALVNGVPYGTHWLPHDARPRTLAGGGKSMLQQFHEQNVGRFAITPRLDVQEGIQAARATLPLCHFDFGRCEEGIEHLKQYHRDYDMATQTFSTTPAHDKSSHAADAFRYLSLVWKHPKTVEPSTSHQARLIASSVQNQSFGQIKKAHFTKRANEKANSFH